MVIYKDIQSGWNLLVICRVLFNSILLLVLYFALKLIIILLITLAGLVLGPEEGASMGVTIWLNKYEFGHSIEAHMDQHILKQARSWVSLVEHFVRPSLNIIWTI